jgi:hypothetical protein
VGRAILWDPRIASMDARLEAIAAEEAGRWSLLVMLVTGATK